MMRLSAAKGWIVRHELAINLASSRYAHQQYEVDVDLDEVKERLPPVLSADRASKIWLPILRIPSLRPADQRIRSALGADGRVLPLMPQGEVRRYFANAITWLVLNDAPADIQNRSSADFALIRNELRARIRTYIRTGDRALIDGLENRIGIASSFWDRLKALVDPDRSDELGEYWAGIAEAVTYCRFGFFVVVGVAADETAAHISCELLPPELTVKKYHRYATAQEVVGFGAGDEGRLGRWWRWPFRLPRIALAAMTTPARYHLRIPVPELGDLDAVHVQVRVPEDVCAEPAVLHHDQRIRTDEGRLAMQSRCRGRRLTPSPLEVLWSDLGKREALPNPDAGRLVSRELERIAIEWEYRAGRLATVERLTDMSEPSMFGSSKFAPSAIIRTVFTLAQRVFFWVRSGFGRNGLGRNGRLASTDLRQLALNLSDLARTLANEIRDSADVLDGQSVEDRKDGVEALRKHIHDGLGFLRDIERSLPHVEITADDDRREHVIHFHVDSTRTVHQRTTDSRPVINAIVRPSRLGRNDFVGTASLSCLTSTVLLVGLFLLVALWPAGRPNAEALVAILLLVPGLSVSLLGRVSGETMRQLVLGRAQRLASLSLIPPVVSAAVIAAVFGNQPSPSEPAIELPLGLPALSMAALLAMAGLVSGVISMLVVRDRFRGFGTFGMRSRVLGLITYRADEQGLGELADDPLVHDEALEATTNFDRILQLTEPALFQIIRPSQRFMVWVVQNQDEPHVFRQVIDVLENLPRHLRMTSSGHPSTQPASPGRSVRQMVKGMVWGDHVEPSMVPNGNHRDPTIVESSLVMSVATTGVTMSIVSHDLASGARGLIEEREIVSILREELSGPDRSLTVVVEEIDDDTRYFRYRALRYEHFAFVGQDDKTRRRELIDGLLKLESDRRRISYLYCPIPAQPDESGGTDDEGRAAIRVGFAVTSDEPESDDHLRLRLTSVAHHAGFSMTSSRSVADGNGSGLGYRWEAAGEGRAPHMLLSAGPDDGGGLGVALDVLGSSDSVALEGGTVLTDGGYTCRSLRFWADDEALKEVRARLQVVSLEAGDDPTHWRVLRSGTEDPVAGNSATSEPQWLISWIRWRLELGSSTGVAYLLSVLEEWAAVTRGHYDWWVTFSNIEFLANRLHDRRLVSGKARYRLGVRVPPGRSAEDYAEEINQSLEMFLRAGIDPLLTNRRRYIVVDGVEPQNPLTVFADSV